MKILFIVPPETISLESSVPKALEGGKGYYPKLGLLYVAAYYERETGTAAAWRCRLVSSNSHDSMLTGKEC